MKHKLAKIGIVTALATPLACNTMILSGCSDDEPVSTISEANILDINDFHGACVGYGDDDYALDVSGHNPGVLRLADTINTFKKDHPNTVVVSAGDNNSGDSFSTAYHAETTFKILSKMGVDYSAVGNHAFEWGTDYLNPYPYEGFQTWGRTANTQGNYLLSANILNTSKYRGREWHTKEGTVGFEQDYLLWKTQKVTWADPYKVININHHPICLIGLTTDLTETDGKIDVVKEFSFIDYIASVHYAKQFAREQLGDDAFNSIEAFVLLTHIESDYVEDPVTHEVVGTGKAVELAQNVDTPVDAVISGHSHKTGTYQIVNHHLRDKKIWVGQAGTAGRAILNTQLKFDDSKPRGKRLQDVNMNIITPFIDINKEGGGDPDSTDPEVRAIAFAAANKQYNEIIDRMKNYPDKHFMSETYYEFVNQKASVNYFFTKPINKDCITTGERFPAAQNKAALGHQYIWPGDLGRDQGENDFCLEQMGAWMNYAMIQGSKALARKAGEDISPSISFINFDSITHEFLLSEGQTKRVITQGDIHQLQTYENQVVYGKITIGQLCNVIDYLLAGEGKFEYGEDNPEYKAGPTGNPMYVDPITGAACTRTDIPKLKYLCSPLQFWGMRFQVDEIPTAERVDRRYKLHYETTGDGKVPEIYIYNPEMGCDILDPATWISAKTYMDNETLIPIVMSSFIYTGGNHQATMFEPYMFFNGRVTTFDFFTRDAMVAFCEGDGHPTMGYDIPKILAHRAMYFGS